MVARDAERPSRFACDVEAIGSTTVVRPAGELDIVSTEVFDAAVQEAVSGPNRRIVIDLRDLTFMDSTGLRLMLKWDAFSRGDGYDIEFVRGPEVVDRLLALTRLDRHFTFVDPID